MNMFLKQIEKDLKMGNYNDILMENRQTVEIKLEYFDLVYSLVVGLFHNDVMRPETTNFHIGMFYKLMDLLDVRIHKCEDKEKLVEGLLSSINSQLGNRNASPLFLVLTHFLEPDYDQVRSKSSKQTPRLRDLIVSYYVRNPTELPFKYLYKEKIAAGTEKTAHLKDALGFNEISCDSMISTLMS